MAEGLLLFYYFPNTSQSASLTAPLKGSLAQCLPLRGKPAKRRQRRKKRAGFEEAARLAGSPGTGNRFAATVRLSAKLTERCCSTIKKEGAPLPTQRGFFYCTSKVSGRMIQTGFPVSLAYQTVCPVPLGLPFQTASTMSAWSTIYWFRFLKQSGVYCRCNIVS